METFIEDNKDDVLELNKRVSHVIKDLNIKSDNLELQQCLKIIGAINNSIRSINVLSSFLQKIEDSKKAGVILAITIHTLNSEEVKAVLSEDQRNFIKKNCQDTETKETIINFIDWVSESVNSQFDLNKDGYVTEQEIKEKCKNTCSCCPKMTSCWSTFLLLICCSGKTK